MHTVSTKDGDSRSYSTLTAIHSSIVFMTKYVSPGSAIGKNRGRYLERKRKVRVTKKIYNHTTTYSVLRIPWTAPVRQMFGAGAQRRATTAWVGFEIYSLTSQEVNRSQRQHIYVSEVDHFAASMDSSMLTNFEPFYWSFTEYAFFIMFCNFLMRLLQWIICVLKLSN